MPALDLAAFWAAPLTRMPFDYLVLPGFVRPEACAAINAGYPSIDQPGSFPIGALTYGPAFRDFVEALTGPDVQQAFEEKFQIDLRKRPTIVTVRGRCGPKDGSIHTDAVTKLITVLIYMNPHWEESGGRLRLLRSAKDIEDALVEVPPEEGTLVAFRRGDNSFHGHKPFTGPRRVVQLNWVTDRLTVQREILRHRVSAWMKRVLNRKRRSTAS